MYFHRYCRVKKSTAQSPITIIFRDCYEDSSLKSDGVKAKN